LGGSGYGFVRSIATLIPTQNLHHILSALQMLRICLSGPPKRRKQPERYVSLGRKILETGGIHAAEIGFDIYTQ
jgi:hypothetical protein